MEKTELQLAQELIAKTETELQQKAVEIYNEAIKVISEMGYNVVPKGEFVGNQFKSELLLVKK